MPRPKKGYDARAEVRLTPETKKRWESLVERIWGPDATLSSFLRRGGELFEEAILKGEVKLPPTLSSTTFVPPAAPASTKEEIAAPRAPKLPPRRKRR